MTKRWLDPSFFTDEKVAKATMAERQLFAALIANQDDDGRLQGHPGYLRSIAFPYDHFSIAQVRKMRDHLAEINKNILVYQNSGNQYIQLKKHKIYQNPRYYHPSKLPPPAPESPSSHPDIRQQPDSNQMDTIETPLSHQIVTEQQPLGDQKATEQQPSTGLGGVGIGLGKREISKISLAEKTSGGKQKPKQADAGIFLDMVEQHIGTKLVQRPKLMGQIRPLLVKFPEATPQGLLDCFKWLKQHDPYCQSRDSPMVISMLSAKYPEWAAGKLPAGDRQSGPRKLPTGEEIKRRTDKFMRGES